jgi:hypothetical protein
LSWAAPSLVVQQCLPIEDSAAASHFRSCAGDYAARHLFLVLDFVAWWAEQAARDSVPQHFPVPVLSPISRPSKVFVLGCDSVFYVCCRVKLIPQHFSVLGLKSLRFSNLNCTSTMIYQTRSSDVQ